MSAKNDRGASGANGENPADDAEINDQVDDDGASGDDDDDKPVNRSTYKKTVNEAKKARERARKVAEENEALRAKLLEAEGNKDEKIKTLSQQLAEAKKAQKALLGTTIKKALSSQVKSAASKAGTIDADAVMSLLDLSDVEVDSETLEADGDLINEKITALKKSKPYLFSKAGPNINGKMPTGKVPEGEREDLSKLTVAELKARIRELDKK